MRKSIIGHSQSAKARVKEKAASIKFDANGVPVVKSRGRSEKGEEAENKAILGMNRKQRRQMAKAVKVPWQAMPKFTAAEAEALRVWQKQNVRESSFVEQKLLKLQAQAQRMTKHMDEVAAAKAKKELVVAVAVTGSAEFSDGSVIKRKRKPIAVNANQVVS